MATGVYKITDDFEKALSDYTGAPYVVTVDNQSNVVWASWEGSRSGWGGG